jgi:DNA-binding CsgD family transcriptional regulator
VAIAVAQGRDIAAIAVATSRREGTVRTLLKRAFAKTGTCRQNALAAVLWAGAGSISSL